MNLIIDDTPQEFFVFIDPENWLAKHNLGLVGSFATGPTEPAPTNLMFVPNKDFQGFVSPFQNNLMRNYTAEYNLEINRDYYFKEYPPRLQALFLLPTEEEAVKYKERHLNHVGNRTLKKCKTVGNYRYSTHDSAWVNFLRLDNSKDQDTLHNVSHCYWTGDLVKNHELSSRGESWTEEPIIEVLFLGQVDFEDRNL